ncbi:hypothetical protein [Neisseria sp. 74A18]|nr:hypothetical protein [Neisseria sp. 74A18]
MTKTVRGRLKKNIQTASSLYPKLGRYKNSKSKTVNINTII